jgi:putative membrane protein
VAVPDRPAPGGPVPDETFRLHGLTPVALGGRVLGLVAAFTVFGLLEARGAGGGGPSPVAFAVYGAVAVVVVVRGLVTVACTRYRLIGGELRIDTGLLRRQSKRIRLDRLQSVDVLEPLAARLLGLAEVKVTTAGSERAAVRLRYLSRPVARSLRADMLGRSTGVGPGLAEAPERILMAVPHGRLVGSVLLEMVSWRLVLLLAGPVLVAEGSANGHGATAGVGVALFVSLAIVIGHAVWTRISGLWEFTVSDSPDGLRVRHGLLSTSRQTVPPGRVQALLIHQPLFWRPFGWVRVRMNVAGYGGADASKRTTLLPVSDRAFAEALVGWLLGGMDLGRVPLSRPPRRATLRAPLWWRAQRAGADDHCFVAHHGLLSRTIDVVPHQRTQSLRLTAGPLERALGLASVHLDSTRGPVRTRAANRDATGARTLLDREVERSRSARQLATSPPGTAPVDLDDAAAPVPPAEG